MSNKRRIGRHRRPDKKFESHLDAAMQREKLRQKYRDTGCTCVDFPDRTYPYIADDGNPDLEQQMLWIQHHSDCALVAEGKASAPDPNNQGWRPGQPVPRPTKGKK